MDDAGDAGASEDGELIDTEGIDDGSSDSESPNGDMTADNSQQGSNRDSYHVFESKFDDM